MYVNPPVSVISLSKVSYKFMNTNVQSVASFCACVCVTERYRIFTKMPNFTLHTVKSIRKYAEFSTHQSIHTGKGETFKSHYAHTGIV